MHPALTDPTPLPVPLYIVGLPAPVNALRTIGDAARYIVNLPAKHRSMIWSLAGGILECAHHDHSRLEQASNAMAEALCSDGVLNEPLWNALRIARQYSGEPER